jgi:hypothetical protein
MFVAGDASRPHTCWHLSALRPKIDLDLEPCPSCLEYYQNNAQADITISKSRFDVAAPRK